ncbi:hypothetical protein PoB_002152500 [Plakobranchus ocellatus]|uniref:Guanylate cyclase domain-containing protein n=1 Tax=Plakobranchus ocellatus TaxID=259542 RepID=A0AAV3ZKE3_9GAST|nr:hypothetical protein PoB_002152500 [Plakobranchus ocellatus]
MCRKTEFHNQTNFGVDIGVGAGTSGKLAQVDPADSAANIHERMKTVYGEMCISDCAVCKWVRIFKGEDPRETILRDRKRSAPFRIGYGSLREN